VVLKSRKNYFLKVIMRTNDILCIELWVNELLEKVMQNLDKSSRTIDSPNGVSMVRFLQMISSSTKLHKMQYIFI